MAGIVVVFALFVLFLVVVFICILGAASSQGVDADEKKEKPNTTDQVEPDLVLGETAGNNNLGIALERAGDIDGAVAYYEKNIALGYPATHAFERLRIIYRRRHDVVNELRVLRAGVAVFSVANDMRMASALRENPQYEKEIRAARLAPKNGTRRDPSGNLFVVLIPEEAKYRMRISVLLKNNPELK